MIAPVPLALLDYAARRAPALPVHSAAAFLAQPDPTR